MTLETELKGMGLDRKNYLGGFIIAEQREAQRRKIRVAGMLKTGDYIQAVFWK